MSDADDSKRCPECRSSNIYLEGTREHRPPRRTGTEPELRVVARTLYVRCRRCKNSWTVCRRITE